MSFDITYLWDEVRRGDGIAILWDKNDNELYKVTYTFPDPMELPKVTREAIPLSEVTDAELAQLLRQHLEFKKEQ